MPLSRRTLLAAPALLAACGRRAPDLPDLGRVPSFTLTDQNGAPFSSTALAGRPWIASFMFTHCQATCPRMNVQIRRLQEATASLQLVSFTVDIARDTPEVLAAYARRLGADLSRWHFLTGDRATLGHLARNVFQVGDIDGSLEHSSRMLLVDADGRYRGAYPTSDEEGLTRLRRDLAQLSPENL